MRVIVYALPLLVLFALLSGSPALAARTPDDPVPAETGKVRYFYDPAADYGVQALYSPLFVLVNRGLDIIQSQAGRRQIFGYAWGQNLENVGDNVLHFPSRVSEYGWGNFAREELFPLDWDLRSARWAPNYSLHLIGGGMTYRMLREWFDDKDVPAGWLWSSTVVMASAFLNEALENSGNKGRNTDCIADVIFFDIGGILLFSLEPVARFFGVYLHLSDWSLQPSFTLPEGRLHNVGNYFSARVEIYDPLSLFTLFGDGSWFGVSWRILREDHISFAEGVFNSRLAGAVEHRTQVNEIKLVGSAGVFWDRRGTPLASLIFRDVYDQRFALNLYPGIIFPGKWSPGVWAIVSQGGSIAMGLSAGWTYGVGTGYESPGMKALDP